MGGRFKEFEDTGWLEDWVKDCVWVVSFGFEGEELMRSVISLGLVFKV